MKAKVRALPRTFLRFGITDMKLCGAHLGELRTCDGAAKPSPWGRWRGAALLRRTVTDEVSPPLAGFTAARTLANLWLAAVAASAPSEGFGFRAPPVADTTPQSSLRLASSPSIRSEAPSFIVARAAKPLVFGAKHQTQNVVRRSRTNILPKIHRGAEKRAPSCSAIKAEPCGVCAMFTGMKKFFCST